MTKTLEERAAVVAKLKKGICADQWWNDEYSRPCQRVVCNKRALKFIFHSPQMAQLIADQQARIKELTKERNRFKDEIKKFIWDEGEHIV